MKSSGATAELDSNDCDRDDHRGFATSITHCFQEKRFAQTDACSLACCGMLQSDRDRYLVTGISPPSWYRRIFLHFLTPLLLFAMACYGAMNIRDAYVNQLVSTLLVAFTLLASVMQFCFKGPWKRIMVRKELLWRKYQKKHAQSDDPATKNMPMPDDDDDDMAHAKIYHQGQSKWDLQCVHGVLGCYKLDLNARSGDEPSSLPRDNDLCAKLFRFGAQCCCGKLCCYQLQTCGLCGVAQEARELSMLAANRRRIDYVTMQDTLQYYGPILKQQMQEQGGDDALSASSLFTLSRSLSQLSHQLLQLLCVVILLLLSLGSVLDFHLGHVMIVVGTFAHSFSVLVFTVWWTTSGSTAKSPSLDLIIKSYACGFFVCTLLAVVWEILVGMTFRILVVDALLALSGVQVAVDDDGYEGFLHGFIGFGQVSAAADRQDYLSVYGQDHPFIFSLLLAVSAFVMAAFIEELVKYLGFNMILDHPDFWSRSELESAISAAMQGGRGNTRRSDEGADSASEKSMDEAESPGLPATEPQQDLWDLPLQAQDKSVLTRGATTSIAMVSVALGFACCETLVYIFVYNENTLNVGKSQKFKLDCGT